MNKLLSEQEQENNELKDAVKLILRLKLELFVEFVIFEFESLD